MRLGSFQPGTTICYEGKEFRLLKLTPIGSWQLESVETGALLERSEQQLHEAFLHERLELLPSMIGGVGASLSRESMPICSMPDADQAHVLFKTRLIQEMRDREFPGWLAPIEVDGTETTAFHIALQEACQKLGRSKGISASTYYVWRKELQIHGEDVAQLRKKPRTGVSIIDPRVKAIMLEAMHRVIDLHCGARRPAGLKPLKPIEIFVIGKDALDKANEAIKRNNSYAVLQGRPVEPPLELPQAKSTLYDWWNSFPAEQRSIVTKGPGATRHDFRGGRGIRRPEACLDRVEYDEWRTDIFLFDEDYGFCYGRPWLAWFYCGHSQLPVGIYLGFEEQSDLSLTSALRSACLPKAFLKDEFPSIGAPYPVFGIPRLMIFDNGMSQHGNTVELLTLELRNQQRFTPSRTGWFKPHVEGSFKIVNEDLVSTLGGAIIPGVARQDYDPTKHGFMGFRAFYELLWTWIVHCHATGQHSEFKVSRLQVWQESCAAHPPSLVASKRHLDELFWVLREGKVNHKVDQRGVWYEGLRYYSAEMDYLRAEFGSRTTVAVKTNPADLEFVLVRPRPDAPWFRVQAVDDVYARGRSLMQHLACRAQIKKLRGTDTVTGWLEAQQRMRHAVGDILLATEGITANRLAAKLFGIGSQHQTAALNHQGRLQPPVQPVLSSPRFQAGLLPDLRTSMKVVRSTEASVLPVFDADLSLTSAREGK